jgi:predicted nuclease of predicted toxin-antitoxin system
MNLYLDDDSAKTKLVAILRRAGHRVWTPAECGMVGVSDARHFEYATRNRFVLLTRNYEDFAELHDIVLAAEGTHYGIFVIRLDNDPTRDMTDRGIVNAIGRLESSNVPLRNEIHILNHWRSDSTVQ